MAGAFENLKLSPERQRVIEKKEPFWKENWHVLLSVLLMAAGYILAYNYGQEELVTALAFGAAIIIGGNSHCFGIWRCYYYWWLRALFKRDQEFV
jgi:Zn2+/Cd2+-exporting ATPase